MIKKIFLFLLFAFFFLLFVFGWVLDSPQSKERHKERTTIELCWKEQSRKSFDPATARFAAGICEGLEREFTFKWGFPP